MAEAPPVDRHDRALFRERLLSGETTADSYVRAAYTPIRSWEVEPLAAESASVGEDAVTVLTAADGSLRKTIRFTASGGITVEYDWKAGAADGDVFTVELSLFRPLPITATPEAELWRFPVETVSKSERGLDRTVQGESITLRWPASLGHATVRLGGG